MKLGVLTVLFIVFLILKLTNMIAWSWLWVTAPLWGGVLVWGILVLALAAVHIRDQKRPRYGRW